MSYFVYSLTFDTPVHFGKAELGGKLEQTGIEYPADTLFSALCCELAQQDEKGVLESFVSKVKAGAILFSDLFPYVKQAHGQCYFYLPKPILVVPELKGEQKISLFEVREKATARKKQKKMNYLRASSIKKYFQALSNGESYSEDNEFGMNGLMERVCCRREEPLPYYVGQYTFLNTAGLYGIVKLADDADGAWLQRLIKLLGFSGIGGKRSSGYGKFHIDDEDFICLKKNNGASADLSALASMLMTEQTDWQMNISILLPDKDDIPVVKRGQYKLRKRSGFIAGGRQGTAMKRNDVYMVCAGSCVPQRIPGRLISYDDYDGHPVLRYGKGLYVGL